MANTKTRSENTPVFTTVRVTSDTNKKLAKAVDKYNDRHPGSALTKDEFLSLLLDYCSNYGIDIDDAETPQTSMNRLRRSVKSLNDSSWASMNEMKKFVQEQKERTDKIIAAEKEVCDTLAELVGDENFNKQVLQPIKNDLENLYSLTAMRTNNNGQERSWTLCESLIEILNRIIKIQIQTTSNSKDRENNPTLLDKIDQILEKTKHTDKLISSMKTKRRFYGWEKEE